MFRTEGPLLESESYLYVERAEDEQIVREIRRGSYVALIGAREMGKTSLLLKLRRQLLEDGHLPMYLDLSLVRHEDEQAWYHYFLTEMLAQLNRDGADISVLDVRDHFDFRQALRRISLDLPSSQRVVILLDELSTLPLSISERFLSAVRAVFKEREAFPEFRRYVFVMAGAFLPDQLVGDLSISPFDITSRLYTSDADREGLAKLLRNLERFGYAISDQVIDRIYHWTEGHVYLTQRLCSILARSQEAYLTPKVIDLGINDVLDDRNIRRVYERLDNLPEEKRILHRILVGEQPLRFNRASRALARLELIGVIKPDVDGYCTVRNAIYGKALDRHLDHNTHETQGLTRFEHRPFFQYSPGIP